MKPVEHEFESWQGKTFTAPIQLIQKVDDIETPVDLTGFQARMQVRKGYDSEPVLSLTSDEDGGIEITDAEEGKFTIGISADQTADLEYGRYRYDIEFYDVDDYVMSPFFGRFRVHREVTR